MVVLSEGPSSNCALLFLQNKKMALWASRYSTTADCYRTVCIPPPPPSPPLLTWFGNELIPLSQTPTSPTQPQPVGVTIANSSLGPSLKTTIIPTQIFSATPAWHPLTYAEVLASRGITSGQTQMKLQPAFVDKQELILIQTPFGPQFLPRSTKENLVQQRPYTSVWHPPTYQSVTGNFLPPAEALLSPPTSPTTEGTRVY